MRQEGSSREEDMQQEQAILEERGIAAEVRCDLLIVHPGG
jgi:hypothetical protein